MKYYVVTFVHTKIVGWALRLHAHVKYLNDMLSQGALQVSGPFVGTPTRRTMLIFSVESLEQLNKLVANDPYSRHGLIAEKTINEWNPIFGNLKKRESNNPEKSSKNIKYFAANYIIKNDMDISKYKNAHDDYLKELEIQNKLRIGGEFIGNLSQSGMYVLSVPSLDEAETILKKDPYIANNLIIYRLIEWNPRFGEFK